MSNPIPNHEFYQACRQNDMDTVLAVFNNEKQLAWSTKMAWSNAFVECMIHAHAGPTRPQDPTEVILFLVQKAPISFIKKEVIECLLSDPNVLQAALIPLNQDPAFHYPALERVLQDACTPIYTPQITHILLQSPAFQTSNVDKTFAVWSFLMPPTPPLPNMSASDLLVHQCIQQQWIERLCPEDYVGLVATVGCSKAHPYEFGIWGDYMTPQDHDLISREHPRWNPFDVSPHQVLTSWTEVLKVKKPLSFWEEVLTHLDQCRLQNQHQKEWERSFSDFQVLICTLEAHVLSLQVKPDQIHHRPVCPRKI